MCATESTALDELGMRDFDTWHRFFAQGLNGCKGMPPIAGERRLRLLFVQFRQEEHPILVILQHESCGPSRLGRD
jgi:hypothetical protein